jgi:protein phosphatase-4 regulatory subunit 3
VFIRGLISRWEQNNEPPPTEPSGPSTSVVRSAEAEQEDYFNADSDEEIGPKPPSSPAPVAQPQQKRKRQRTLVGGMPPAKKTPPAEGGSLLGLDYDDGSDSDGSAGSSPRHTAGPMPPSPTGAEVTTGLAPSPMALDETSPTKSAEPIPAASEEELQEIEQKMKAKRMREEQDEEEEGLAGLMGGAGAKGKKPVPPKEEAGKKIKLSFGLAKKLS